MKNTIIAQDKEDLKSLIEEEIKIYGNHCNLNHIDTSLITDMSFLFLFVDSKFNGNIIQWNVSNVKDMHNMFQDTKFNKEISDWDVRNVINMDDMFNNSQFNKDISIWNVENVKYINKIFNGCNIEKP